MWSIRYSCKIFYETLFSKQIFEKHKQNSFSGSRVVPNGRTDMIMLTIAFATSWTRPKTWQTTHPSHKRPFLVLCVKTKAGRQLTILSIVQYHYQTTCCMALHPTIVTFSEQNPATVCDTCGSHDGDREDANNFFWDVAPCTVATILGGDIPVVIQYWYKFFYNTFISTLSPLWDYQYMCGIVYITLSVETQHDEACSSKHFPLYTTSVGSLCYEKVCVRSVGWERLSLFGPCSSSRKGISWFGCWSSLSFKWSV
jgi:hypothetical protein